VRERLHLSQEGLARRLDLSVSEVRRWEQGVRAPSPTRAVALGKLAGPPECWTLWELAGIHRQDVARLCSEAGSDRPQRHRKSARYSEESQEAAFSALELIFARAPSTVIERTVEFLQSRAGKYGGPED
jgi:transcriptional regulator with XRE-family HTH domain